MYYILKSVFHYNFYDCNSNQKKLRKNSNRMKDLQILELMCGGKQPNIDTLQIFFYICSIECSTETFQNLPLLLENEKL